eukprot:5616110-Amphidinium_carterae.2
MRTPVNGSTACHWVASNTPHLFLACITLAATRSPEGTSIYLCPEGCAATSSPPRYEPKEMIALRPLLFLSRCGGACVLYVMATEEHGNPGGRVFTNVITAPSTPSLSAFMVALVTPAP